MVSMLMQTDHEKYTDSSSPPVVDRVSTTAYICGKMTNPSNIRASSIGV